MIIISVVIIVLITVTVGTMFMVVAAALLYFIIFISSVNHNCTMKIAIGDKAPPQFFRTGYTNMLKTAFF